MGGLDPWGGGGVWGGRGVDLPQFPTGLNIFGAEGVGKFLCTTGLPLGLQNKGVKGGTTGVSVRKSVDIPPPAPSIVMPRRHSPWCSPFCCALSGGRSPVL